MASIIKRGKTYALVYYEGEKSNRHQVWESGLSYSAAKARKAQLEYEMAQNIHIDHNDLSVSEFLFEFVEKYVEKKWTASTYTGNVGLLENYVHPFLGDKKLRNIRTKTIDDYYHFLLTKAEPVCRTGSPKREKINASTIHDIHKYYAVHLISLSNGSILPRTHFSTQHCRNIKKKSVTRLRPSSYIKY